MVWAGKEALGKASSIDSQTFFFSPQKGSCRRIRVTLVHTCRALGSDEGRRQTSRLEQGALSNSDCPAPSLGPAPEPCKDSGSH